MAYLIRLLSRSGGGSGEGGQDNRLVGCAPYPRKLFYSPILITFDFGFGVKQIPAF